MYHSYQLVSLFEMLKQYAHEYHLLTKTLSDFHYISGQLRSEGNSSPIVSNSETSRVISSVLGKIRSSAEELKLDAVIGQIDRINGLLSKGLEREEFERMILELISRLEDQLSSQWFIHIPLNRLHYYQDSNLFGEEVTNNFPLSIDDIEESGKCLALGQGTACVMHLMRVMEVGIKYVASKLGLEYLPSWESYLDHINKKIAEKRNLKTPEWIVLEPIYKEIVGDLISVKNAWRNPTMHIGRKYSANEAEEIFKTVRTFMSRLIAL